MRGFIDLHTHGLGPFDTRINNPELILKMVALHREHGTSLILPTIYPADIKTMRENMEAIRAAMKQDASIKGINLEGPFLNPARCGALDKDALLKPSLSILKALLRGFEDEVKIITIAPELPGALKIIEYCAGLGIRVNMGHSDATFQEAYNGKKAGATGITHFFNAMRPIHHREPGIAGFGLLDEDIYVEVIADGIHVSPEMLKLVFKMKRPDRILLVSDSVKGKMGKPVFKRGVLQGGGFPLSGCESILKGIGISEALIRKAGRENQMKFLSL